MKIKKIEAVYSLLIALLVYSMWAFNETKFITYPIKILYILLFGHYALKKHKTNSLYQYWCVAMVFLSVVTSLYAPNEINPVYEFVNMLQVFLIGYVTYSFADCDEKIDKYLNAFVFGGLLLAIRLIIATPINVWLSWRRLGEAIGTNSNDVGNKAAISSIIALCLARREYGKKKAFYIFVFGLMSAIVIFSGSRKALLSVIAAIVLLNTIGLKDKRKVFFSIVIIIFLLVIGYRFMMTNRVLYATIGRRIETMVEVLFHGGSEAQSIDLREKYISVAWKMIKEHPVSGIGLGAFPYESGFGVYSHCDYTEVACSYGLLGALVYYMPIMILVIRFSLIKVKKDQDYMFLIMQFVLLFTYVTMVMYSSAYNQVLLALFVAYYHLVHSRKVFTRAGEIKHFKMNDNKKKYGIEQ